jgi:preprotein translocase subunit SecA
MKSSDKMKVRSLLNKLRGIPIELDLKPFYEILSRINEQNLAGVSDETLKRMSTDLCEKAQQGIPLDDLMVEAFALVRETSWRTVRMRPFDVQVIAGIAMQQGKLAELPTGEGKTLAAVLPAYLNALTGDGVHIHTFNDYLARRDAAWMGPIFKFLGLSVGCIQEGMSKSDRVAAYAADITYSTAKEAGFDLLRDSLCYNKDDIVHRAFHFAIVDEADSILIDEARVPLVIAGSTGKPKTDPGHLAEIAKSLRMDTDIETDEGKRNIYLTDSGLQRVETLLGCGNIHDPENLDLLTSINQALHAEYLLNRDVDYIVRNGRVEIVDEFTGRVVEDRHWPDGLQAAVEAKEKVHLGAGGSILGSITLQHLLQLYPKIAGMTATAQASADELEEFYNLKVVVVPPNKPCIRTDHPDVVFTHKEAKFKALIKEIRTNHDKGRPVLVGTASVEESEELAADLKKTKINCQVLNAKNDELEAKIIAKAGAPGAVTISTNMAGRGTDIKLGGDKEQEKHEVVALGGLYVIGTNRHESLRIDLQLRGRAGRQGDPGSSRFFVSLEDNLIERYGIKNRLPAHVRDLKQDGALDIPLVNKEIVHGQRVVEGQNFEIRKTLWNYSFIIESQRRKIYAKRNSVLKGESRLDILEKTEPEKYSEWRSLLGKGRLQDVEKQITLFHIDRCWTEHLALIADVRESIHLVNVGGQTPIDEFNRIVTPEFLALNSKIEEGVTETFRSLELKEGKADLAETGIRGPSSTWTYLISDSQFGFWMEMLKGKNIGIIAGAVAWYAPLFIAYGILKKLFRRPK